MAHKLDAMETLAAIVTLEGEIKRLRARNAALTLQRDDWAAQASRLEGQLRSLRAINAELVSIVLDDTEGDLDFVKFRVRALFKCKLQPMSDHLIIRLRRAFDKTGNSLLSDAIEELAHRSARNAELVAVVQRLINCPGLADYNAALREAHSLIAKAKP